MQPNVSNWQSSSAYDYFGHLTIAGIAWKWLRRNREYQTDYARFINAGTDTERQQAASAIETRWGLRFPGPA